MVARFPSFLRTLGLLLLAIGPLAFATVQTTGPRSFHASDAAFDDTTVGAIAHPEQVFAAGSQQMQSAQQLAKQHWGTDPCGGNVEIVWSGLASDINAQSSWTNPTSAYDNPSQNGDCKITFNPGAEYDWPKFCTVTVHEYGHLSGRPPDNNDEDVMSRYYVKPVPECKTAEPGAAPVTAAPAATPDARAASVAKKTVKRVVKKRTTTKTKARKHRKHRKPARKHAKRR